ncbi:inorganic triphosphatase [Thiotrichales bacterium HSG1]|nr:inorganic triphosphatase [Thiotrichales bacterium HSG1]
MCVWVALIMIETELKLLLNPEHVDKVKKHSLLQQNMDMQSLYNVYFDTVEHDLLRNKVGFRIRHIGDKKIQTLKTAGTGVGGLHTRQEWETNISSDTPEYDQIPTDALPYLPDNFDTIRPIFVTNFNRITWLISINDSTIEVALDQGEVTHADKSTPINEIELELKSGSTLSLYELALILLDDIPFTIENKSKAALGYELCKPQKLKFCQAEPIQFDSAMTTEQVFIHIVWHCLQHLQINENVVLCSDDSEAIHQMQLALHRLLSCLNLYKYLVPKQFYDILLEEIRWMDDGLTVARDWGMFAMNLQLVTSHNSTVELRQKLVIEQTDSHVKICDMLRSPRYTRTLLLLSKWLLEKSNL